VSALASEFVAVATILNYHLTRENQVSFLTKKAKYMSRKQAKIRSNGAIEKGICGV
jgi:hypothetical protein